MIPFFSFVWHVCSLNQTQGVEPAQTQPKSLRAMLDERHYHRRVVLLYGRADAPQLPGQQQALKAAQPDLDERQMDVITVISSALSPSDRQLLLTKPFSLNPANEFQGWLIGKDGTIKKIFTQPIDPADLFRLVDAMPMRIQEKRARQ